MIFNIYTDGSCIGNKKCADCPGGYAYLIVDRLDNTLFSGGGGKENTTNNIMEMTAVIEGVKRLINNKEEYDLLNSDCTVITDSKYIADNYSEYLPEWKENGWKKSKGGDVANKHLWMEIDKLAPEFRSFKFQWVKAHSGDYFNTIVDRNALAHARRVLDYPKQKQ